MNEIIYSIIAQDLTKTVAPGGTAPATTAPQSSMPPMCGAGYTQIIFLVAIIAIFYFLMIRPQQKKTKEHAKMIDALKKGDEIVTTGGIFGKIAGITDKYATIEIAEKVRIKILRTQIAGVAETASAETNTNTKK